MQCCLNPRHHYRPPFPSAPLYIIGIQPISPHHFPSLCFSIMTSFTKTSLCFFLLCIFSPLQLQARDLTSFSMAAQNVHPSDTTTPAADVARKQPEKLPPIGPYGYGLYGQISPDEYYERSRTPRTVFSAESYGSRGANPAYKSYGDAYDQRVKDGSFGYEVYNYEGEGKGHAKYYEP